MKKKLEKKKMQVFRKGRDLYAANEHYGYAAKQKRLPPLSAVAVIALIVAAGIVLVVVRVEVVEVVDDQTFEKGQQVAKEKERKRKKNREKQREESGLFLYCISYTTLFFSEYIYIYICEC